MLDEGGDAEAARLSGSFAVVHLIDVLRQRYKQLPPPDKAEAGRSSLAWQVSLPPERFEALLLESKPSRAMWHGLIELSAREYILAQPETQQPDRRTETPFFKGVLQTELITAKHQARLTKDMPNVALMYWKRRELRRNNWGHRYWEGDDKLHKKAAARNHSLMTDGNIMSPREIQHYGLRFAGMLPEMYYSELVKAQVAKAAAKADEAMAELVQAEEKTDGKEAGSSTRSARKHGGDRGRK